MRFGGQVLDSRADHGGLVGWCRAVRQTECGAAARAAICTAATNCTTMTEQFYGSLPGGDRRTLCVSQLE